MEKYKIIHLSLLVACIETIYCKFIAKYVHIKICKYEMLGKKNLLPHFACAHFILHFLHKFLNMLLEWM